MTYRPAAVVRGIARDEAERVLREHEASEGRCPHCRCERGKREDHQNSER